MIRPVRICLSCSVEVLEEIDYLLRKKFPSIEFQLENDPASRLSGKYDITHIPTTFPDSYERYFYPFPEAVIEEIMETDLFRKEALDLHKVNGQYYGLPVVYSPPAIEVNCELLERIKIKLPEYLNASTLCECQQELKKLPESPALFDCSCFAEMLLLQLLYNRVPESGENLKHDKWQTIYEEALEDYIKIMVEDTKNSGDFNAGQALFRFVGKGFRKEELNFQSEYMPMGEKAESFTHVFSESLVVSRATSDQSRMVAICKAFLEPEIQQVFSRQQRSIPLRKATAYEMFCKAPAKDKIFMSEDCRCMFSRPDYIRKLAGVIGDTVPRYANGQISEADLRKEILDYLRIVLKQEAISNRFWDEQAKDSLLFFSVYSD
jgi:hypothetical protein